jgi:SAM-dependent methyltransferase
MTNKTNIYSQIIDAESFCKIMTNEHLYIAQADQCIASIVEKLIKQRQSLAKLNVVDIGCGPARMTRLIADNQDINLTGTDIDNDFLNYAKKLLPHVPFVNCSILDFKSTTSVDIFYSQGMHHHIAKGSETEAYLRNIHNQLVSGGHYIVGDEFIADYSSEDERDVRLVMWYSHIIGDALRHNYHYLAQEEAKTLLDDLHEGKDDNGIKTQDQIDIVLSHVGDIDSSARDGKIAEAMKLAKTLVDKIAAKHSTTQQEDKTIGLSRGDYKISPRMFVQEVEKARFKVVESKVFGPIEDVGAYIVYVLQKI